MAPSRNRKRRTIQRSPYPNIFLNTDKVTCLGIISLVAGVTIIATGAMTRTRGWPAYIIVPFAGSIVTLLASLISLALHMTMRSPFITKLAVELPWAAGLTLFWIASAVFTFVKDPCNNSLCKRSWKSSQAGAVKSGVSILGVLSVLLAWFCFLFFAWFLFYSVKTRRLLEKQFQTGRTRKGEEVSVWWASVNEFDWDPVLLAEHEVRVARPFDDFGDEGPPPAYNHIHHPTPEGHGAHKDVA
ncbi:hypothetical protein CC1G_08781 [Coprinopsis cinerea okayama7|uniref:Uncharacterized protein n=1 Tax=Coprinopsis cinerea (strain Okayama-7 / 130 / ATCC MYA-4618 / FGSC 9003) TaxID=240176 RepID=A8N431_COPC7|nr:hypothetical protein CC1G_08781 [Coprinopsis cinerea okayama7\|eukprot:XP_001829626.2 hypothetical protein CC1G_08781 [Coprinopsis cinerea okayama7\